MFATSYLCSSRESSLVTESAHTEIIAPARMDFTKQRIVPHLFGESESWLSDDSTLSPKPVSLLTTLLSSPDQPSPRKSPSEDVSRLLHPTGVRSGAVLSSRSILRSTSASGSSDTDTAIGLGLAMNGTDRLTGQSNRVDTRRERIIPASERSGMVGIALLSHPDARSVCFSTGPSVSQFTFPASPMHAQIRCHRTLDESSPRT